MSVKRSIISSLVPLAALIVGAVFIFSGPEIALVSPNPDTIPDTVGDTALVTLGEAAVVADVVRDDAARARGLGGRVSLASNEGMLFVFPDAAVYRIWMKDMHIPIDIIWVLDDKVIDIVREAPPPTEGMADQDLPVYGPRAPANFVVEVPSGFAAVHGIAIGDSVAIQYGARADILRVAREKAFAGLPGREFFIETLEERSSQGSNFEITEELPGTPSYTKYAIRYGSGDLTISGIMNVPTGEPPPGGYPVLILNHGLISKSIYYSGRGSRREQDFFARNGYVTVHPDYRGHASSSPETNPRHDFYVGYSTDVASAVDAVRAAGLPFVDVERIGMWGHSMGGGMATRVMVLEPDIKAFVLFAPISADAYDNFYELSAAEVAWLKTTYGESPTMTPVYDFISPLAYFERVVAPVQVHHGTQDFEVPIEFSEKIHEKLQSLGKESELHIYPGQKHEFIEDWQLAANRSLEFFDKHVKDATSTTKETSF